MEEGIKIVTDLIQEEIDVKQFDFFSKKIKKRPVTGVIPPFADVAEAFRYLPAGDTERPGKWDRNVVPHLIEILEMCHPDSGKTHITAMKSVQSTLTTSVGENAILGWIYHKIGTCGMFTATQDLAETRSRTTIATMIKRAGLVFEAISDGAKGDTTLHKQFAGNINFYLAGYLSVGRMKSNPMKFIFKDEMDEMPPELKNQGDVNEIIEGRTLGKRMFKVLNVSTPSDMRTSRIYKEFLMGDQRIFHAPCPLCGEKQELELKGAGKDYGLTFTMRKNLLGKKVLDKKTVRYICKHCKGEFKESKKQQMLMDGVWIPTATPIDSNRVSYHVSGLMSPEFALSWERICQQFINCKFGQDVVKFKDFTINYLGKPWATQEKQPQWETLKDRAEDYALGEVPKGELIQENDEQYYNGGLVLFGGVDVQGDRLELTVTAFGADSNRWIVDKQVFFGKTENIDDPCWYNLDDFVYNHTYDILGVKVVIMGCAMDCGYDPRYQKRTKDFSNKASIVYDFVADRQDRFIAVMGVSKDKMMGIIKEAKISDIRTSLTKRYNVHVAVVKELIMGVIDKHIGYGTIHFPKYQMIADMKKEIPNNFYQGFLSEVYSEISPGKFGWKKIYERNENLDTYIYSVAAAEYFGVNSWNRENYMNYYYDLLSD